MRARVLGLGGVSPGGGRCRRAGRAVVAGGNAVGRVAPMAVPEGKRRAAAVAVPYSPRSPLAGPVPAASSPSALCELRRGRGGSAGGPAVPLTHRDQRPSGCAPGWRAAGLVVSAGALQSFRPGLNNAAGAARVWESRRSGRGCLCWVKGACGSSPSFPPSPEGSGVAPLEGVGWDRRDRRGAVAVAESCCDSRALRWLPGTGRSLVLTEGLCCPRAERGRCWAGISSPMYFSAS